MFSCLRRYLSRSLEVTSLLGDAARTTFATIMWRKCKSLGRSENGVCGGSIPFQETAVITVLLFTKDNVLCTCKRRRRYPLFSYMNKTESFRSFQSVPQCVYVKYHQCGIGRKCFYFIAVFHGQLLSPSR